MFLKYFKGTIVSTNSKTTIIKVKEEDIPDEDYVYLSYYPVKTSTKLITNVEANIKKLLETTNSSLPAYSYY